MPQYREGEYEDIDEKIIKARMETGLLVLSIFIPEWGATAAGASFFLIAYNVNILGAKEQAHRIALNIREGGTR